MVGVIVSHADSTSHAQMSAGPVSGWRVASALPDPSVLREYEEISPGTTVRLIEMEKEHQREQHRAYVALMRTLQAERRRLFGLTMGFATAGAACAIALAIVMFLRDIDLGGVVFAIGGFVIAATGLLIAGLIALDHDQEPVSSDDQPTHEPA